MIMTAGMIRAAELLKHERKEINCKDPVWKRDAHGRTGWREIMSQKVSEGNHSVFAVEEEPRADSVKLSDSQELLFHVVELIAT